MKHKFRTLFWHIFQYLYACNKFMHPYRVFIESLSNSDFQLQIHHLDTLFDNVNYRYLSYFYFPLPFLSRMWLDFVLLLLLILLLSFCTLEYLCIRSHWCSYMRHTILSGYQPNKLIYIFAAIYTTMLSSKKQFARVSN